MIISFLKRHKIVLFVLGGALLLYAFAGFLILPGIVRPRLHAFLAEKTGRTVRLGDLAINPFTLSITLKDLAISERDTATWLGFRELYVNYDITSLVRREYRFDAIRLEDPTLALRILRNGGLSIQDLIDSTMSGPREPADTAGAQPLVVADLVIRNGSFLFEDRSRPTPFRMRFDSLSLALREFTTRPDESGRYVFSANTTKDEQITWRGRIGVRPLESTGEVELRSLRARTLWEYLQDRVNYEVAEGSLDLRAKYVYRMIGDSLQLRISDGAVSARNLRVLDRSDTSVLIAMPAVKLTGLSLAFPEQAVHIVSLTGEAPELLFAIRPDSSVNWVTAFATGTAYADSVDRKVRVRRSEGPPWAIRIDRWASSRTMVRIRDASVTPAAFLEFGPMDLAVTDLRYGQTGQARFTTRTAMNGSGEIRAQGTLRLDPFLISSDLTVRQVSILPVAPYLRSAVNAAVRSGFLSFDGRASLSVGSGRVDYGLAGTCAVGAFHLTDYALQEDLVRMERLELRNLTYRSTPPVLNIQEIVTRKPFIRFVIGPDHVSNFQRAWMTDSATSKASLPTTGSAPEHLQTRIGKVTVTEGSMRFADLSMTPRFATGIEGLQGVIMDLSSEQLARADVDLKGKVDRYAPALISGQINPLSEQAYTDILFRFQNLELTTFSTYFTRFVGYRIEKGKLSVDLRYRLNNRMLKGENKIVIDQLTLGESVEGPDVTSLPVKLAIALLKDRNGVIDVDLPVEGSLDDPEFRFGPLIWKALTNLVVKLVTAPFALLGSLFGGGDELKEVHFLPGSDSLLVEERTKLDNIAKALRERPALRLDVRGIASEQLDRRAIAERRVNRRLGMKQRPTGEELDEYGRVRRLYEQTFGTDPVALLPPPKDGEIPPPEAEQRRAVTAAAYGRLVDSTEVPGDALRMLASRRADAIRSYVVQLEGIDASRVFLLEVDAKASAEGTEVRMPLTLNAL